jgi:uncharacterized protein (TIGR03083 family)
MSESPWPTIHAERLALLDDLTRLTPEQWGTRSLCNDWDVRQAFGHIVATARKTPMSFVGGFTKSGFSFQKMVQADVKRETAGTVADQLDAFRGMVSSTSAPPGPVDSWLGETIVHSEDIRRPLGISHTYPMAAVTRLASFYSGSDPLIGSKTRIAGMTLRASDADWTVGSGPLVEGPALSLLLAMTGRKAALAELTGPGVATLSTRT